MTQWISRLVGAAVISLCITASVPAADDPLPSWNDGATKQSIIEFVTKVTAEGGPDYVKPEERVATFDNDGTLWIEQPITTNSCSRSMRLRSKLISTPNGRTRSRSSRCSPAT